ncbi:MAG: ATP synthase F1 subunit gamma [Crocinitomicaceae bacterium]|nr:ATP synthase F1 subunit gamma [Crocinitomicaceae bacterium]
MASLKEIKNRITSISSTMQITSAMKMVSAAKLKRAQDAITQMKPYSIKLQELLGNLSSTSDISENPFSEVRSESNVLLLAISSNRGLCGGFNNNILKKVNELIAKDYANSNVNIVCFGKKITDSFRRSSLRIENKEVGVEDIFADLSFANASEIASNVMNLFLDRKFDKVVIVYNSFVNASIQDVKAEQLLPIVQAVSTEASNSIDYIFEPAKQEIIEELIPKSLKTQFFKALLDSNAAEHGARMTAMHKATDNAKELKRTLTLSYNKARQAAITNEILEIVGGAEALNN